MRGSRVLSAFLLGACLGSAGFALGGCGGATGQDAHEPKGSFAMKLDHASFPAKQAIARPARLTLTVRNTGEHTVPNVAVSVDSFAYTSTTALLAASQRPTWIVDTGPGAVPKRPVETQSVNPPGGAVTAFVNTWALGALAAGHSKTFVWKVTPVVAGRHTVHFTVAAGLNGKARAKLTGEGPGSGQFTVTIAGRPPVDHVDPDTGQVVPGPLLATP